MFRDIEWLFLIAFVYIIAIGIAFGLGARLPQWRGADKMFRYIEWRSKRFLRQNTIILSQLEAKRFIKAMEDANPRTEDMIAQATCYEDIGSAMLVMSADENGGVYICSHEGDCEVSAPTFRDALTKYLDASGRRE